MRLSAAFLFAATALVATGALANIDLARKSNCLACHTTDRRLVGPAYQEVARKYAGDRAAEARLADKVKKGGVGVWGKVPMPPNSTVKDEDIKTLVRWILSGAK
jgi:cytochrome c